MGICQHLYSESEKGLEKENIFLLFEFYGLKKKSNQSLFLENRCWVSFAVIYTKLSSDISFCCLKLLQLWIKHFLCFVYCKLIAPVRWIAHLGNTASYCILVSVFFSAPMKTEANWCKRKTPNKTSPTPPWTNKIIRRAQFLSERASKHCHIRYGRLEYIHPSGKTFLYSFQSLLVIEFNSWKSFSWPPVYLCFFF